MSLENLEVVRDCLGLLLLGTGSVSAFAVLGASEYGHGFLKFGGVCLILSVVLIVAIKDLTAKIKRQENGKKNR